MNCCRNCFSSEYLINVYFNECGIGNCDFCGSTDVRVILPRTFSELFDALLSYYQVDQENGSFIENQIRIDFPNQILSDNRGLRVRELLQEILGERYRQHQELFGNRIILSVKAADSHIEKTAIYNSVWENFKQEIKFSNRFHILNVIDLEKLKNYFNKEVLAKNIDVGEKFYRGRVSKESGYKCEELWNPPIEQAKAGRANPYGISYLYLSDQVKTSLYETRSTIYDFVTIGEFEVKEKLSIVDLRNIAADPIRWVEEDALEDFIVYMPFLTTLQSELSRPVRSSDKEIDYLPTQYLSEFIKSLGYDGVKFQSSFFPEGFNLAIFNPSKFECNRCEVYEIQNISYQFRTLGG
jgi:hypothetical protein